MHNFNGGNASKYIMSNRPITFSKFLVCTNFSYDQNQSRGRSKEYTKAGARMEKEWNEDKDVFGTSVLEVDIATKSNIQGYSLQGTNDNTECY